MPAPGCTSLVHWVRIGAVPRSLSAYLSAQYTTGKYRFEATRVRALYASPPQKMRDVTKAELCLRVTTINAYSNWKWGDLSVCEEGGGFLLPHGSFFDFPRSRVTQIRLK